MLGAALLIPAGLLATQITISEVTAEREAGRVAITVKGDAMIDPEAASAKLTDGRLYLFVRDARVREANRSWDNGAVEGGEEIRAHRHPKRVELAIPLGDGGCQGPVEFQPSPGGLRALVACDGGARPTVARVKQPETSKPTPKSDAIARPSGPAPLSASEAAALKAKLSLEPEAAEEPAAKAKKAEVAAPVAQAPKPLAALAAKSPVGVGVAVPVGDPKPAASAPATKAAAAPAAAAPSRDAKLGVLATQSIPPTLTPTPSPTAGAATATTAGSGSPASGGPVLAGFALVAVAAIAFYYSRRRRAISRHIEILETASLGPKRALVVARVGGARMILGSSEAGITLLQSLSDGQGQAEASIDGTTAAVVADPAPIEEAQWDAMVTATLTPVGGVPATSGIAAGAGHARSRTLTPTPAPMSAVPVPSVPSVTAVIPLAASLRLTPAPADFMTPAPTLISVPPAPSRAPSIPRDTRVDISKIEVEEVPNPTSEIRVDIVEEKPVGQAGVLARLFRRGAPANDAAAPRFEDVLEDSFEDQELRRKLALGLSGRVR